MSEEKKQTFEIVDARTDPKHKVVISMITAIVSALCSILTVVVAFIGVFNTIPNIIQSSNEQKQTQVVIEPRDGDIIVKDGDDYKLLQLINISDISFPTKIQEVQYQSSNSNLDNRVEIGNINNENWDNRDSFRYVINNFSINSNKIINLLPNIKSIDVYCDFYTEKNISTFVNLSEEDSFKFNMWTKGANQPFAITKDNVYSENEYVTKEINDGIEWVKIRVKIIYEIKTEETIDNIVIIDTLTSDWIETDADIA